MMTLDRVVVAGSTMKNVLFFGLSGSGITTNMMNLRGSFGGGYTGRVDENRNVESFSFLYTHSPTDVTYNIAIFDHSFTGYELIDLNQQLIALQRILNLKNVQTVSRIFFCYKWGRMTEHEAMFLEFVKNVFTESMKDIIHVIVTHAPNDYFKDEDSRKEFQRRFSFLIQEEDDLKNRFTFVNLINPIEMENNSELTNYMRERWRTHRNKLLEVIVSSDKVCFVNDFKATNALQDWVRLNVKATTDWLRFDISKLILCFLCLLCLTTVFSL